MTNNINVTYLILGGHVQLLKYRYFYFTLTLVLFVLIVCSNTVIFYLICISKSLHQPMYIFVAALLLNSLFGSFTLYPKLLTDLLSAKQVMSHSTCILQSFLIYVYAGSEFTLLSAMAYDRYISICRPLQYHTFIRTQTVKLILLLAWLLPTCEVGGASLLTARLKLCRFVLKRILCDNFSIVKLTCEDTTANSAYGLVMLIFMIFLPVTFIMFSYGKILAVCVKSSKDFKSRAFNTCLPHVVIFINFTIICVFEVVYHRVPSNMPHALHMILSILYMVIPPIFNPLIYGFKMHEIYKRLRALLHLK